MQHGQWITKKNIIYLIIIFSLFCLPAYSAVPVLLPGSAQPGLVTSNYLPAKHVISPKTLQPITPPEEKPPSLSPEAAKIKFKLTKIILEGNHVYSNKELESLYQDKINTTINIPQLQQIVESITAYYRNNGYILSRAILPPQHVSHGVVQVRVIEGYIDKVKVTGTTRGSERILMDYGNKIAQSRPLQLEDLEYYLLLANELPGVSAKAVFEASKTTPAATDITLIVEEQPFNTNVSYDDYGTLYIGPHQVTAMGATNSYLRSGDTLRVTYLNTPRENELRYLDVTYQTPVGAHGFMLTLEGNRSLTNPGFTLEPLFNNGKSNNYFLNAQYPVILSRSQFLTLDGGFTYSDSIVYELHQLLYQDYIRSLRAGGTYNFADSYNGVNNFTLHIEQGLNMWGASDNPQSTTTSRPFADGIFTKWTAQYSRLQPLFSSPFSLYLFAGGQTTNKPLLVYEQFNFGGSIIGRGYDPAELLGDKGVAGSTELRWDFASFKQLRSLQFYTYYDIGKIWNIENVPGTPKNQSASSTGFGTRFSFTKYINGNLMYTQVLTKPIASEALIGRGFAPKIYFSVVAAV